MPQFPSAKQLKNSLIVSLGKDETKSPTKGTSWLILFGGIRHITGTNTYLKIYDREANDNSILGVAYVSSSSGSASYPLFSLLASTLMQQPIRWFVVHDTDILKLTGGTGVRANLRVVVF